MALAVETESTPPATGQPTPTARRSLKEVVFQGSTWTVIEYGGSQALRFVSSIILSHLLKDPAIFGINLILMTFMQALDMFSDLGIGQSIVQNKRGGERRFLDTAWTMQVLRGVIFSLAAVLIAWPVATVYSMPILVYVLPVAGLAGIITGLNSTNLFLLNREVRLGRLAAINVGTQFIGLLGTVALAMYSKTIWALVFGALFTHTLKMIASHPCCPGPMNRFAWDRDAIEELFHFGKWIFLSTLFSFLAVRGDRLILGWYMPSDLLGAYGFAIMLAYTLVEGMHQISNRVLFPVYARIAEEHPDRLRAKTLRLRSILMALSVPPMCVLVVFGREIVGLIYPEEFQAAGWMLQILSAGFIVSVIGSTVGPVLLAMGDSYRFMIMQASRAVIMCLTMGLGGYIGSRSGVDGGAMVGVVIGIALPEVFLYPVLVWAVKRYGVWLPKLDFAGVVLAGVCIALLTGIKSLL